MQLRLKGAPTAEVVALGRALDGLDAELIVNDDVDAALELGTSGCISARATPASSGHARRGIPFGISVTTRREGAVAEFAGATYLGAGPIWRTPSKPDAAPPIGIDGLRDVCLSVSIPVVAIGGVDASNAAECIRAGAAGVAVIRGVAEIEALRAVVDEAL